MGDLISRDDTLKITADTFFLYGTNSKAEREIISLISRMPSAEPKRGKWRHYEGVLTCMECGAEFYDDIMEYTGDEVPHFCPDCGANMEVSE